MSNESLEVKTSSSFTDLFIRRPVLAIVVNLVIVIAGVQAIRTLNVRQYPRSENASITVTTVYVGANAELVRGFITTPLERAIAAADGIDYLESQSTPGPVDHQRAAQAQLRLHQGAGRDQLQGRPGARRPAARGRGAGHQHRVGRQPVRLGLPELLLRVPAAERDHRLPGARGAAAADRGRGRAAGRHPRRPHLRHAHLAQARPDGGARTSARPRCARRWRPTTTWPRSGRPRARSSR